MPFQYTPVNYQQPVQPIEYTPTQQQNQQQDSPSMGGIQDILEMFKDTPTTESLPSSTVSTTGVGSGLGYSGSSAFGVADAASVFGEGANIAGSGFEGYGVADPSSVFGSESLSSASSSASSSSGSSFPIAGIVMAAIAAQHGLSKDTDTEVEGVRTKDAFEGHFATEPWLAWAHDKLGMEPTEGEKFDAAFKNKDYETAIERHPEAFSYWADPATSVAADGLEALGMDKKTADWFNPVGKVGEWAGDAASIGGVSGKLGGFLDKVF
jgi:hypothetical protein